MLLDYIYELDKFYSEVSEFLLSFSIDEKIFDELLTYQKSLIVVPGENSVCQKFDHDWHSYFEAILSNKDAELIHQPTTICFYAENAPEDWEDYARQIIWYGRRNKKTIRKTEKT